ncbi:hypothetical protein SISNIDRAFT_552371 [Sistotremastrum niveocremeum HHB9708]|uniref:Uncharacterized protein n=1 Tax=Sistotremastrum niveocremeum HHB9708 TaxID=1314777 RepID=A0A164PMT8_9AGAM|nr:hypothetical protein SISNIDRAFT_552371 [Sistotremastrum niveocremeum HHB9708]
MARVHLPNLPAELIVIILVGLDVQDLHSSCGRLRGLLLENRGIWAKAPCVHLLPLPAGETIHTIPLELIPRLAARAVDIQRAWDNPSGPSEPKSCHIVDSVALYDTFDLDGTAGHFELLCILPGSDWIIIKIGDATYDGLAQILVYSIETGIYAPICHGAPASHAPCQAITIIEKDILFACTLWSRENGAHQIFLTVFRLSLDHDTSPSFHMLWQKELESSHPITQIVWSGNLLFCQVGKKLAIRYGTPCLTVQDPRSLQAHPFLPLIIYRCGNPFGAQKKVHRVVALELPTTLPAMKANAPWLKASLEETSLESVAKTSSWSISQKRDPKMTHNFFGPVTNMPSDRHDGIAFCNLVESYRSTPPKVVVKRLYWNNEKHSLELVFDKGPREEYPTPVHLRLSNRLFSTKDEHGSLVAYQSEENLFLLLQFGSFNDPSGFRFARVQAPPLPRHSASPKGHGHDRRFKMVDFTNGRLYYETWLDVTDADGEKSSCKTIACIQY